MTTIPHKRALFVTTVPITLAAFLLPLARAQRADGWRVDAMAASASTYGGIAGEFDAVFDAGWSRSLASFWRYFSIARQVRRVVLAGEYDVVHVHTPIASFITRAALRGVRGVRVVYTAHGFHFYEGQRSRPAHWLFRTAEALCLRWTDKLVVINDEDEAAAFALLGRLSHGGRRPVRCAIHKIDGVGIDLDAYAPVELSAERMAELRDLYELPEGSFVVTIIAEMNENKRHRLVLDAARILREAHSLRFLFIGTGSLEGELRQTVRDEGLPVVFAGQVACEPLRELLTLTDLGLLVSEREGLPRSLMELTAAQVPIAGTRTRGITDEVRDERALAAEPTGTALAALIETLATNDALRSDLVNAQYYYAKHHFALDVVLPQYLKLYR